MKTSVILLYISLLSLLPRPATAQQMDMAAMQYWGTAELIKYHIVGVYQDATFIALRVDFCWDVRSQLCEEWRLRRGAVLRWVRGWYAERGITALPQAVAQLPPIDPHAR